MDVMKGIRVPERLYKGVLWLVSIVLAAFLVGFGNLIIGDLPQVEPRVERSDFVETPEVIQLRSEMRTINQERATVSDRLDLLRIQQRQAESETASAKQTFEAWIQTRRATTDPTQDPEVIRRTRELEQLQQNERSVGNSVSALETQLTELDQRSNAVFDQLYTAELSGMTLFDTCSSCDKRKMAVFRFV
jgi:outer membrane murein-binding lipoprotein Lpp